MSRICLYFKYEPLQDRWLRGDHFVRPFIRRIIRGKPRYVSGVDRVFVNLCAGLDQLGIKYTVNLPFSKLKSDDWVGVVGRGPHVLKGYRAPNPIVAGVALMTHPSEWPTLCGEYPVVKYLQHSEWANNLYKPYFGERCAIWPVGIDTEKWKPYTYGDRTTNYRTADFLIYDKVRWEHDRYEAELIQPIRDELTKLGLIFREIRYGFYMEEDFRQTLQQCKAMIFLCEHESQGLAYQECLSSGVPILAWDQGWCLDPNRFRWGQPEIPATSVPYFDERCGLRFQEAPQFPGKLDEFWSRLQAGAFRPRDFVLENLTLEKCAQQYVALLRQASQGSGGS